MSSFSRPLSQDEIAEIGSYAARRNAADGVTGVLLTLGSVFFQIIEGDRDAVDDLYQRVLRDDRHTDIICLQTEPDVDERLFPDWSMNVFELDQVGGDVVDALKLVLGRMSEAQHIIERYTQPAVSRIMTQGLNPLDVPLRTTERLVMFSDIVAFSAISDRLPIEDVSVLVNTYLEICSTGIVRNGGEVTKYLGDGVMAYFDSAGADAALQSCVDIQRELERVRLEAPADGVLRVLFSGFGLAAGPVIEGTMGSSVKVDYTVIGEPVNSAARLEALTRDLGAPVLMTEAVAKTADATWELRAVGEFDVGRDQPATVFALDSGSAGPVIRRSAITAQLDDVLALRG